MIFQSISAWSTCLNSFVTFFSVGKKTFWAEKKRKKKDKKEEKEKKEKNTVALAALCATFLVTVFKASYSVF